MTSAILPFESEEEMNSAFTQKPDPKVIASYWADELQEDGSVQRSAERMAGTDDLTDWAQAVAAAIVSRGRDAATELAMQGATTGACRNTRVAAHRTSGEHALNAIAAYTCHRLANMCHV